MRYVGIEKTKYEKKTGPITTKLEFESRLLAYLRPIQTPWSFASERSFLKISIFRKDSVIRNTL